MSTGSAGQQARPSAAEQILGEQSNILAPDRSDQGEMSSDRRFQKFRQLLDQIDSSNWRQSLVGASRNYNIKNYNIEKLSPNKILALYRCICSKFYNLEKNKASWHQNQLRVYIWVLLTYSGLVGLNPQDFRQKDNQWTFLSQLFMGKTQDLCQFQFRNIRKQNEKGDKWTIQEDQLLKEAMQEHCKEGTVTTDALQAKNRWNDVAKEIFSRSGKRFFRSAKQCRQRWNNYLDPLKTRQDWTGEQDQFLITKVLQCGKKWSMIGKLLKNRTEHMVKNRYKSLISREVKKITKSRQRYMSEVQILKMICQNLQDTLIVKEKKYTKPKVNLEGDEDKEQAKRKQQGHPEEGNPSSPTFICPNVGGLTQILSPVVGPFKEEAFWLQNQHLVAAEQRGMQYHPKSAFSKVASTASRQSMDKNQLRTNTSLFSFDSSYSQRSPMPLPLLTPIEVFTITPVQAIDDQNNRQLSIPVGQIGNPFGFQRLNRK